MERGDGLYDTGFGNNGRLHILLNSKSAFLRRFGKGGQAVYNAIAFEAGSSLGSIDARRGNCGIKTFQSS